MRTNQQEVKKLEEINKQVNQLEEIIKKLTGDQMEQDKAHTKELSNFHRIYAEKMKWQEQKYVVEVLKVVEAMKENKEYYKTQIKEDKDCYVKQIKLLKEE